MTVSCALLPAITELGHRNGVCLGFFSAQQVIRYSKICISLQQNSQKNFHKRSFLLKGEVVAQSLPSVKPLGKLLKKVWKACILIYCISILCSEMFRGKFPWSPALMCFSSSVCAEAELMIPTRSACLPLSVLKYFLYIFFFPREELFLLIYDPRLLI